ncbi:olfactory receptor 52K1-like [Emydura macquarii macquarii]|uniref:olfactory receptor 52K1-like n=1 Tax=Emydura macquarii macquarii TaxID=1129001 RepID=UPI00352BBD2A
MAEGNQNEPANVSYAVFLLLGFPGIQQSRSLLFIPFFCLYVMIVVANSLLIHTVKVEESLHSPMYVLIALLLAVDICSTSTFLLDLSEISLAGCLVQMFFFYFMLMLDCNILLMMALDRYVAICKPLRYAEIMTKKFLIQLTLAALVQSVSFVSPVVVLTSKVRFCRSNVIRHFVCENMALMRLSCGDISRNKLVGLIVRSTRIIFDGSFLLASYSKIIQAALKITSGNLRHKAFHTCSSHLTVILVVYCSSLSSSIVYWAGKSVSQDTYNLLTAMYLLLPCAINPIVHGLRTKEIREHLWKLFKRRSALVPLSQQL